VPEEFTLLTAGFLIAKGVMNPLLVVLTAMSAALVFDSVLYVLARSGASYAVALRDKAFTKEFDKTRIFSPNHPLRTIFFLRFFMGFRLIGPLYAGFSKIPWPKFALVTLASIGIYFPFVISMGYIFNRSLPFLLRIFRVLHVYLLILLIVVVLGILAWYLWRAWKRDVLAKE
jgi:membrane protein DedA with SNARE-associated domain